MIETAIYDYIVGQIPEADITWGKLDANIVFTNSPIISFFKVPSQKNLHNASFKHQV